MVNVRGTIVVLLATMAMLSLAVARDDGRYANSDPALRDWYRSLKQPGTGVSCCDISDCEPVDFEFSGSGYRALVDGRWLPIPAEKVIYPKTNPTGRAVLCSTKMLTSRHVLCFAPGSGS